MLGRHLEANLGQILDLSVSRQDRLDDEDFVILRKMKKKALPLLTMTSVRH